MRGGIVIVLLGLTAFGAYYIGRQDMRTANTPSVIVVQAPGPVSKPLALTTAPSNVLPTQLSKTIPPGPSDGSAPPPKPQKIPAPQQGDTKRRVEVVLTAAAIAAILVKASRDQYHATGRPCACPDDTMRNGRACGGKSAYSRPGGAAPLCYPTDITPAMVEAYRKTAQAQR